MISANLELIDASRRVLAVARVDLKEDLFAGEIDVHALPDNVRAVFDEYEEIVNTQMFSFLDEIQRKIEHLGLKVILDNGQEAMIKDLQVYPSTRGVSFKLATAQIAAMKSA